MAQGLHKKTCEYEDSFKDFIAMIKSTKDLDMLKPIRYYIVSEIMQATRIRVSFVCKLLNGTDMEDADVIDPMAIS